MGLPKSKHEEKQCSSNSCNLEFNFILPVYYITEDYYYFQRSFNEQAGAGSMESKMLLVWCSLTGDYEL